MDLHSQIEELRQRIDRLERGSAKRGRTNRGRTNRAGAARYLGVSEETLRQRHDRGEGPLYSRNGRYYSYSYDELDSYAEADTAA
jgi:hypothetical protein